MKNLKGIIVFATIALLLAACSTATPAQTNATAGSAMPEVNSSSSSAGSGTVSSGQQAIEIKGFAFNPDTATVKVGTQVTWTNNDSTAHTVTADDHSFDSGVLNPGGSFTFQFTQPGTYSYICTIHPMMQAKVIVVP